MPDFTYEMFGYCASADSWQTTVQGSNGNNYSIRWDRWGHKNPGVSYDYSCTCPDYQMRKRQCKHIKKVIASDLHCNWNQLVDGGKPQKGACPKCGAQVYWERHAV